jgi:hypothetical protein
VKAFDIGVRRADTVMPTPNTGTAS